MKHNLLALSFSVLLAACGGSDSSNSSSGSSTETGSTQTTTSDSSSSTASSTASSSKGAQLIATSDCLSCHKEHEKLVGPAYADVAKKYENTPANIEMLANKIIKGGAGNWGEIQMTPHPSLSKADAEEMAGYVLSLR